MFDLTGKVALVTGGNGGIGLGMATGLAQAGATVVLAGRDAAKSGTAVTALRARDRLADSIECDVTRESEVAALFQEVMLRHLRLDVLVNNAGTTVRKPPHELSLDEWNRVMDTNLTSAFLCCRAAHALMKEGGGGKIVNIGSMLSIFGAPYAAVYRRQQGRHRPVHEIDRDRRGPPTTSRPMRCFPDGSTPSSPAARARRCRA